MQWPHTQPPQPASVHQSPFFRHVPQPAQLPQQPAAATSVTQQLQSMQLDQKAMGPPPAPRWQQPQQQPPPQAPQQQSRPMPPPAWHPPQRPAFGSSMRYPQAQLQIRAYPPAQQQTQQQRSFPPRASPATFVQRAAAAAAAPAAAPPNAPARFPPQPQQYAMAPFPPMQQTRTSAPMGNGMQVAAAAPPAPFLARNTQQPRPPQQPPQTPLQVGSMSGGRFIPSAPQPLPPAAFAAPVPQPPRPRAPIAAPALPPLPSSSSWRFDHALRKWNYEPQGIDRMRQPTSEKVGTQKQYIADQLYWSRDMYRSLCDMLHEAEKKETNKLTVWSKVESASIDNQLWHKSVPVALLNPADHFGVGSALQSSGTREWLPGLGVDMSRPPVLKLTGWTHTKPTRCILSAKQAARMDLAMLRAQHIAPPRPPPSPQEVPQPIVLNDEDNESEGEKKVSGSRDDGDERLPDPDFEPQEVPEHRLIGVDANGEDDGAGAPPASSASAHRVPRDAFDRGHRYEQARVDEFRSKQTPHRAGMLPFMWSSRQR